jgi:hypothetical protein
VNSTFNYPNYFSMIPTGPDPKSSVTKGFLDLAVRQNPKPQTIAIVAADAEFALNVSEGARENVKAAGLTVVYDRRYPSTTTDLAPVVRAIAETNPADWGPSSLTSEIRFPVRGEDPTRDSVRMRQRPVCIQEIRDGAAKAPVGPKKLRHVTS